MSRRLDLSLGFGAACPSPPRAKARGYVYVPAPTRGEMRKGTKSGPCFGAFRPPGRGQAPHYLGLTPALKLTHMGACPLPCGGGAEETTEPFRATRAWPLPARDAPRHRAACIPTTRPPAGGTVQSLPAAAVPLCLAEDGGRIGADTAVRIPPGQSAGSQTRATSPSDGSEGASHIDSLYWPSFGKEALQQPAALE